VELVALRGEHLHIALPTHRTAAALLRIGTDGAVGSVEVERHARAARGLAEGQGETAPVAPPGGGKALDGHAELLGRALEQVGVVRELLPVEFHDLAGIRPRLARLDLALLRELAADIGPGAPVVQFGHLAQVARHGALRLALQFCEISAHPGPTAARRESFALLLHVSRGIYQAVPRDRHVPAKLDGLTRFEGDLLVAERFDLSLGPFDVVVAFQAHGHGPPLGRSDHAEDRIGIARPGRLKHVGGGRHAVLGQETDLAQALVDEHDGLQRDRLPRRECNRTGEPLRVAGDAALLGIVHREVHRLSGGGGPRHDAHTVLAHQLPLNAVRLVSPPARRAGVVRTEEPTVVAAVAHPQPEVRPPRLGPLLEAPPGPYGERLRPLVAERSRQDEAALAPAQDEGPFDGQPRRNGDGFGGEADLHPVGALLLYLGGEGRVAERNGLPGLSRRARRLRRRKVHEKPSGADHARALVGEEGKADGLLVAHLGDGAAARRRYDDPDEVVPDDHLGTAVVVEVLLFGGHRAVLWFAGGRGERRSKERDERCDQGPENLWLHGELLLGFSAPGEGSPPPGPLATIEAKDSHSAVAVIIPGPCPSHIVLEGVYRRFPRPGQHRSQEEKSGSKPPQRAASKPPVADETPTPPDGRQYS